MFLSPLPTSNPLRSTCFFYLFILSILLVITSYYPFPTDAGFIGLTSPDLDIGDKPFYLLPTEQDVTATVSTSLAPRPSPLYPFILSAITYLSRFFGFPANSLAWNTLAIAASAICMLLSMRLLYFSTLSCINKDVASRAILLFAISPYTYFYTLSGGITSYMILGTSLIMYFLPKSIEPFLNAATPSVSLILALAASGTYISLLRPTGAIFIIVIASVSLFVMLYNRGLSAVKSSGGILAASFLFLISISSLQLLHSHMYVHVNLHAFTVEMGTFMGYPRDALRDRISDISNTIGILYASILLFTWKIMDFILGMSDLRDTFLADKHLSIIPFLFRGCSGLFFLAPFNLLVIMSLVVCRKSFFANPLSIIMIASAVSVSPSLLGVAMSRYWIMFYISFFPAVSLLINRGNAIFLSSSTMIYEDNAKLP